MHLQRLRPASAPSISIPTMECRRKWQIEKDTEMAAFETNRPVAGGALFGGRVSTVFADTFAALSVWNDARITRKALGKLSDRELDDIGLSRGDIDQLASRA